VADIRWERQLHQAGSASALAVTAGHVVVHERNTRLVSLDPVDGSVRWDILVGTWPRAVVVASAYCLVIPQNTRQLLCLDLDTGKRVWSFGLHRFAGHLVVAGDTVLVGGWRGYTPLHALEIETGRLRWETENRVHTVLPVPMREGFLIGEPGDCAIRLIDRRDARPLTTWTLPPATRRRRRRASIRGSWL
jgi:outer membrane protein assembly factor BamB